MKPNHGNIPPCDKFERDSTPLPLDKALEIVFNHIQKIMEMVNEIKAKSAKKIDNNFEQGGIVPINLVVQIDDVRMPRINKFSESKTKTIIIPPCNGEPLLDPIKDKDIIDALLNRKD